MYTKSQLRSLPPDIQLALKELNKEEACSNLNQARLGKRISFDEKSLGTPGSVETINGTKEDTGDLIEGQVINLEPQFSYREPIRYKMCKSDD